MINEKKPLKLIIIEEKKLPSIVEKKPLKLIIIEEKKLPSIVEKKPLKLIVIDEKKKLIDEKKPLKLFNEIKNLQEYPSDHMCYVLKSLSSKRIYVGYTVDFNRRLRQHNGELVGGAKKTEKGRPWIPICHIKGFYEKSSALRFEWRIQHSKKPKPNCISNISIILTNLINKGDGLLAWPNLNIIWI
jgi:predicted GIY-YIG superfamily endonuclease